MFKIIIIVKELNLLSILILNGKNTSKSNKNNTGNFNCNMKKVSVMVKMYLQNTLMIRRNWLF